MDDTGSIEKKHFDDVELIVDQFTIKSRQLNECKAGDSLMVKGISEELDSGHRLRELGLMEGSPMRVIRTGDPMLVLVEGSRLAVDRDVAAQIEVCDVG